MLTNAKPILACVLCLAGNLAWLGMNAQAADEPALPACAGKVEKKEDPNPKAPNPDSAVKPNPATKPEPVKPVAKPEPAPVPVPPPPPAPKPKTPLPESKPKEQPEMAKPAVDPAEAAAVKQAKELGAALEAAIAAEDFAKVEVIGRAIESEGRSSRSSPSQVAAWSALLSRYAEAQSLLLQSYLVHRLDQVSGFSERVRQACLEGKTVRELEMLQLEAMGLSLDSPVFRYQGGSAAPWRERLDATKNLLDAWTLIRNYIDQGYQKKAAERIEYFMENSSQYPIIARKDLDELVAELKGPDDPSEGDPAKVIEGKILGTLHKHLHGVEKPGAVVFAAVAAEIAELQPMAAKVPPYSQDVRELTRGFMGLARVRGMLDSGNTLQATYDLPDSDAVKEFAAGYYANSRNALAIEIVQKQFPELCAGMAPNGEEKLESYLFRLLVSPEAEKVPETRLRLLRALVAMGYRERQLPDNLKQIQEQHEAFVKAETELRVGDLQSAVRFYRTAAYDPNDLFGLAKLAESRIADIKEETPEALAQFDEKMINEMKTLGAAVKAMAKEIATLKAAVEASTTK